VERSLHPMHRQERFRRPQAAPRHVPLYRRPIHHYYRAISKAVYGRDIPLILLMHVGAFELTCFQSF
jgi:hypothetical protein